MRHVKITADFTKSYGGKDFVARTGLRRDTILPVEAHPAKPGAVWVRCPTIARQIGGEFREWSDGYCELMPGEFCESESPK